ncbi:unnamed protein product [Adineta ricciae]|uniref:Uncharacterized protein n=1 Tax=Adineta ricciae TaxID=249248 RepID=A0A815HPN0_ADIRI|nr:unnamed protein product [Adineta ricciae]
MPGSKGHQWKILAVGRQATIAEALENFMHESNYNNVKVIALENDKDSDDKFIEMLKSNEWDAVSIGAGVNGFADIPHEVTTLHWFNRLVNLVHQHSPKAKLIFVTGPEDLPDAAERVLGVTEASVETV